MSICQEHSTQGTSPHSLLGSLTNSPAGKVNSTDVTSSVQEGEGVNAEGEPKPLRHPYAPNILAFLNKMVAHTRSEAISTTPTETASFVPGEGIEPTPPRDDKRRENNPPGVTGERFVAYKGVILRTGFEQVIFPDGVYLGTRDVDGHLAGCGGAEWNSGDVYEGEWLSDRMHGSGIYTWPDGDYYDGQYVNGYMCGFGVMKDAGSTYKGDWLDDMREGMGKMIYANNDVYEGEWLAGMRHGRGKLVESNGNVYEGEFVRNEREGKGILTKKNGDVYEGEFMMGMFNGRGMYIWADEVRYIGYFKNGMRHGQGMEFHPNGEQISGNFTYGKIDQQHQVLLTSKSDDFVAPELPDNLETALEPLQPKQLRQLTSSVIRKESSNYCISSGDDFNKTVSNYVNPDNSTPAVISTGDEQNTEHDKFQQQNTETKLENVGAGYYDAEERIKEVDEQDLDKEHPPCELSSHLLLAFPKDILLPVFSPCPSPSNSSHMNLGASITSMSFGLPIRQRPLSDKDLQDWRQVKIIGKGSFGSVYEALLTCGRTVCCKVVHLGNAATREDLLKLKNEISLMKRLYHTNIVQYYGCLKNKSDKTLNIFMEFVSGGSLSSFVKKFKKIPYETMRQWTYQMVCGVRYLHNCGIVHRDIKGDNVLVSLEGIVKLADFGCSKHIDVYNSKDGCATMVGTPYWMAPEVIKCDARGYGTKSDIWSIGCTIVEMLTGRPPWPECNSMWAAVYKIANSTDLPTEIPRDIDPQLMNLLEKCFERDPQKRPSAEELLQHPFLSDVAKDSQHDNKSS
ncbi:unnamed protein product [Phytomonas sp. Hart1]|nr:unnamed protein product [Phytomonas sp. Hart1]|eukprot:CCW69048.1 unnamed protein product [Phytomonas sp. isolate Hart1]